MEETDVTVLHAYLPPNKESFYVFNVDAQLLDYYLLHNAA